MRSAILLILAALPTLGQSVADSMLSRLEGIQWTSPHSAHQKDCRLRVPVQLDIYATTQWTHHCQEAKDGILREYFYYVFGEPPRTAELRVDVQPQGLSPETTADVLRDLKARLTERFGKPTPAPEMMEIGFRYVRYGESISGDHWHGGSLHYFLHANRSASQPLGVRTGVQLIVVHDRLMQERLKDELIHQVDGLGGGPAPPSNPSRAKLSSAIGAPYTKAVAFAAKTPPEREQGARQISQDALNLLREAVQSANDEEKALRFLAADALVSKLSALLIDSAAGGEREAAEAVSVRQHLAAYGVKLGAMTHYGGLLYESDLLHRVWREFPDTDAGELAFLQLQGRGWDTSGSTGCPKNPDLFREVIDKGETFLRNHPNTRYRKEVVYSLAVANESWWSIARAPAGDPFVDAPPYPRRAANAKQSSAAKERAIKFYREVVQLAPESAEAASALRRLPRLELSMDTGQRRFFCSYC